MEPDHRRAPVAELALVGVCAIWGLTFVMVEDAIDRIPTMTFLAYRFLAAAALVAILFRRAVRQLSFQGWQVGLLMGVFLTAAYIFQTLGLDRTSPANAGFITGLFVVLTPLFGALLLRQKVGPAAIAAAGVSAVGLYLLSGRGEGARLSGDALVFVCACMFSFHILVTDRAVKRHDVGALLAVQLGLCGAFCLGAAAATGDLEVPGSAPVWSALAVTAIFASALGFFVQTYAQQHAPPARTALILASEPAFAGFFAWVLAGQTFTARGWLGAALIFGAIVTVQAVPYLRPASPLPEHS